jgi:hypothetical protein
MNPTEQALILDLLRDGQSESRERDDLILDVLDLIAAGKAGAARATIRNARRNRAQLKLQILDHPTRARHEARLG